MLISFTVENWMSFKDKSSFTMTATKERKHGERVPKLAKYQARVLPVATIYGGNASGKTNFFKALNFAKYLVTQGTQPESLIPVEPYRLDDACLHEPSSFNFELLIQEKIYEFSFKLNRSAILEEKLVEITSTSEKEFYHRVGDKPNFHPSLKKDDFLRFAFQGTRHNQLFLTNSVSQKVETFRPIYDWFKHTLELVAPDTRFEPFENFLDEDHPLYATMNELLPQLDTGIHKLGGEPISFDNLSIPESIKKSIQEQVKEGTTIRMEVNPNIDRFAITRKNGELTAKKLISYHTKSDGTDVKFEMRHESDGSQRVINLLPAILELSSHNSNKVYVIDEIDRSLHTLLTRKLLEVYLSSCNLKTRSQLLMTTHDVLLMDQDLLRKDEMWVAERDATGSSKLYSFSDYQEIRYDKDIRKSYLQGRLGGIPRILLNADLTHAESKPMEAATA